VQTYFEQKQCNNAFVTLYSGEYKHFIVKYLLARCSSSVSGSFAYTLHKIALQFSIVHFTAKRPSTEWEESGRSVGWKWMNNASVITQAER
jgi:hypothetical protein